MTIRNLEHMLAPRSVALVGASPQTGSVGAKLARNLLAGDFQGPIRLVNPKYAEIDGIECFRSIDALPETPDLAVVSTPAGAVVETIRALNAKGTRAAVVITAGLSAARQAMLDAARPDCMRLLGPNCLGLMLPRIGLNASFSHRAALPGDLAFVSQSGALVTAVVDWAASRSIGFSHVLSIGDMADVDFGDLLDYLAGDADSRAILLYMEAVTNPRKFISAARRAARVKPVIVVKSGRHEAGARAAFSHTGAVAAADGAYEAAFRRTGLLRVTTLDDLFAAAEILARAPRASSETLTILTNGGGAGVLAADELQDAGGKLTGLSPATLAALDGVLPSTWSHANPVDIIGDAGPERYEAALTRLLDADAADAILVMQCPTALASSTDNARTVIGLAQARRTAGGAQKLILTNWLGEDVAREARELFAAARIPTYETPTAAITGFMQIVRHGRAQAELSRTPPATDPDAPQDEAGIGAIISRTLASGATALSAVDAKTVLQMAGIPVARSIIAATPEAVRAEAGRLIALHGMCVVKILSPDISHKSDVGGVALSITSAAAAAEAAAGMQERARTVRPDARLEGFLVEPMIRRPNAEETIVGMTVDQAFGPMILFGAGGVSVEVVKDSAMGLPPLDTLLARQMIDETRIARLLAGYRDRPAADRDALARALVRVSELVVRHPEIRELDINPLLVDDKGVIALDARMRLADEAKSPRLPLAIRPYPAEWRRIISTPHLPEVPVRPVRPTDEGLYQDFFAKVSATDLRMRFFAPRKEFSHKFIARLTQIDYAREMALLALAPDKRSMLGVVRLIVDPDLTTAEYGILVRTDLKGKGLGWALMNLVIEYARSTGISVLKGTVLSENTTMLRMARELGFEVRMDAEDPLVHNVALKIAPVTGGPGASG